MDDIRSFRSIKLVYWTPSRQELSFEIMSRKDEDIDGPSLLPAWVHGILSKTADVILKGMPTPSVLDMEYWLNRIACRINPYPATGCTLWYVTPGNLSQEGNWDCDKAPTLWYDPARSEVRVGKDYYDAKRLTLDSFIEMSENEALEWANDGWSPPDAPGMSTHINRKRV